MRCGSDEVKQTTPPQARVGGRPRALFVLARNVVCRFKRRKDLGSVKTEPVVAARYFAATSAGKAAKAGGLPVRFYRGSNAVEAFSFSCRLADSKPHAFGACRSVAPGAAFAPLANDVTGPHGAEACCFLAARAAEATTYSLWLCCPLRSFSEQAATKQPPRADERDPALLHVIDYELRFTGTREPAGGPKFYAQWSHYSTLERRASFH